MLEKIAEYALEQFEGNTEKAAAFMDGFIKEAMNLGGPAREMINMFGGGVGRGLGALVVGAGAALAGKGIMEGQRNVLHGKFKMALESAISSNRILREANHEKVNNYGETIFKFAPHVAVDPNLLSSVLANAIHGDGIDPNTIKMLGELENRYQQNTSFSPKSFI